MDCVHQPGAIINFLGYDIDPCQFDTIEEYRNVTICIMKCPHCGKTEISWFKQEDTEEILPEEWL